MMIHILIGIAVGIPIGWSLYCILAISHRADVQEEYRKAPGIIYEDSKCMVDFRDERGDLVIIKDVDPKQIIRIPKNQIFAELVRKEKF